jgi:hypothetical protein
VVVTRIDERVSSVIAGGTAHTVAHVARNLADTAF